MRMEENAPLRTIQSSIQALGRGFDVNYDARLLYCKGVAGSRLVEVDEEHTRDLTVSHSLIVPNVSRDVRCSSESDRRESNGACGFYEVWRGLCLIPLIVPFTEFNLCCRLCDDTC